MKRTSFALAGTTAVLLGAGALVLPAVAAPGAAPTAAAAHSTTLTFHSVNKGVTVFKGAKGRGIEFDVDRALNGQVIGYDILDFVNGGSAVTTAWVTVGLSGGTMSGVLSIDESGSAKGHLSGGTGRFKGVHGTISAVAGTPLLVTVKYHH